MIGAGKRCRRYERWGMPGTLSDQLLPCDPVAVTLPVCALLCRADLPDHPSARDLDEWSIAGRDKLRVRVGLTKIPNRAVIHDIGTPVRAELDIGRPVEPGAAAGKGLFKFLVVGEPLDLQGEGLGIVVALMLFAMPARSVIEIDQLDLVSHFGCRVCGVGCREPEITLETV